MLAPSVRISSTEIPASAGVFGPGDTTTAAGRRSPMAATVVVSLRTTTQRAPSSPSRCTRLKVKES